MKRNGDIASLFRKHEAKKLAAASSPPPAPATKVIEEEDQEQSSVLSEAIDVDNILPPQPQPQPPTPSSLPVYDINRLPHDPGERLPIASYDINDQDAIRRTYVL